MNTFRTRSRRLLAIAGMALLAVLLAVPTAWAFEGRGGDVIVIGPDEVVDDDLYVAANRFTLDGTIKGDLVVVGSSIEINGTVEGDLIAAGQGVVVNGTVEDDARIAGYALVLGGEVGDDVLAAYFSLEGERESVVGGDLVSVGYQASLAGDVAQNAQVAGGAVLIGGTIGGDVNVDVGEADPGQPTPPGFPFFTPPDAPPIPSVPAGLTIDDGANIGGDLSYKAIAQIDVPSGVVEGDVDFNRYIAEVEPQVEVKAPSPAALVGRWFLRQVRRLVTLLLVGAAMMWLVPDWTRKMAGIVEAKPLPSLGWGVVALAAFLLAMLVLFTATVLLAIVFGIVTLGELAGRFAVLGTIAMSAAAFGFSVTWSYATKIVVSLLLGQLIFRLFKSPVAENRWWPVLLGVLIFVAITAIPVLGWLAGLAAVLLGLGAVWLWGRDWLASRRAATVTVESELPTPIH